jgi:flagellar basal body-associated protein FliL
LLGGIVLTVGFLTHSQLSRESSKVEIIYTILISAAIMLVALAVVAYMVVHVDYVPYEVSSRRGPYAEASPEIALMPIVHHIYEQLAAVLVLTAIGLAVNAFYIKSRMP